MYIGQKEHRLRITQRNDLLTWSREEYEYLTIGIVRINPRMTAWCKEVVEFQIFCASMNYAGRVVVVGQAKEQMQIASDTEALHKVQPGIQVPKGIIGELLIHHIFKQTEGKRGMHAITAAFSDAEKPNPRISEKRRHGGAI